MDFDLTHLVLTFALGSAALLLALGLLHTLGIEPGQLFIQPRRRGGRRDDETSILLSATAIAVAVAVGLVLENAAKRASWLARSQTDASGLPILSPLSKDMDLRRSVLLAPVPGGKPGDFYPTPLLQPVLSIKPRGERAEASRKRLEDLLRGNLVTWQLRNAHVDPQSLSGAKTTSEPCYHDFYHTTPRTHVWPDSMVCVMHASPEALSKLPLAVNDYFYSAKNEVFRNDNYFEELRLIEDRENFARAFAMLCLYGGAIAVALLVAQALLMVAYRGVVFPGRTRDAQTNARRAVRVRSAACLVGVLLVGYLLSETAYTEEANEFYLRVFGYFVSLSQGE